MAEGTNVGKVSFSIEIDNRNQIRAVVADALGGAQREADRMATSINKSTQSATNGFASMAKGIGLLTVAAIGLRKAFNFGKESISLASDLQEVQNVVDVTFGSMSNSVNEFASTAIDTVGLSQKVAKQYMGAFGAMSKSFGFTTEQAYTMAESLTSLSGDVASFYNLSSDAAYTKLKSVFTGETESLKDLGVVMTQSALDAYALEQGFGKTTSAMTEQEKTLLRYQFVMDRLSLAQGDFLRTQDGWANQTRVLKLRFDELKATIGEGLIIALTPVVQVLNTIIARLTVAAQAFTSFIKTIFGVKETESATQQTAENMNAAGAGASGFAEGTGEAAKNLAKAKKSLMGFDKLYKLSDNSSSGGGAGGGSGINIPEVESGGKGLVDTILDATKFKTPAEIGKMLSDLVLGGLTFVRDKLKSIDWEGIGKAVGEFLAAVDWTAIFMTLGEIIFAALNGAAKAWKGMFDAAPLETSIITAIALLKFTPLGGIVMSLISKSIAKAFGADAGTSIASSIGTWISSGFKGIKGLGFDKASRELVFGAGTMADKFAYVMKFIGGIGMVVGGAITAIKNFIDMFVNGFSWIKEILMVVGIAITAIGAIILGAPAAVAAIIAAIVAAIGTLVVVIKDNWEAISKWFTEVFTAIGNWLSNLWASIWGWITNAATSIATFFANLWKTISTWASNAWSSITTWFSNLWKSISGWFNNLVTSISSFMSKIGSGLKNAWTSITGWFNEKLTSFKNAFVGTFTSIKDGVVNIFKMLGNALKSPINAIIGFLNKMIGGINNISMDVPDWVPGLGGKKFGFNIPKIPMLANGGYVKPNNPQLAIIGDNKRQGEIVAPEGKITEAVNQALLPFINTLVGALRGPQTAAAGGDIVIPVYIGNEMLEQYIVNAATRNTYRSGR